MSKISFRFPFKVFAVENDSIRFSTKYVTLKSKFWCPWFEPYQKSTNFSVSDFLRIWVKIGICRITYLKAKIKTGTKVTLLFPHPPRSRIAERESNFLKRITQLAT